MMKYTKEDLAKMQALPLNRKIQIAQTRIIEWYQKWNGQVIISFSGGKDSTVLLHLVRTIYPDVEAVYCDTGLEYPEIKQFVKTFENVTIVRPKMSYRQVINAYGYPLISKEVAEKIDTARRNPESIAAQKFISGSQKNMVYNNKFSYHKYKYVLDSDIKISSKCCSVMKKRPIYEYLRKTGKKEFVGTMTCESKMRENAWRATGCNAFDGNHPRSAPLSIWTEEDVLTYILDNGLEIADCYGDIVRGDDGLLTTTLCKRTGCVFCGFGAHLEKEPNRFQRLRKTHPQLWEYCMRDFDKGGLGMKPVLEYIGVETGENDDMTLEEYIAGVTK